MDISLNKIKCLIKQKIGLDSNTIGDSTLDKIINRSMLKCDISKYETYYILLNNNTDELNALLETAVIPETWFFRDIRPFEKITQKIKEKLALNKSLTFRILSIPCSTGEEPYSLSMYLIDKGIPELAFSIDAVDVSQQALQLAQQGIYTNNSFRGKHYHHYQENFFIYSKETYSIKNIFKDRVCFKVLNILKGDINLHNKFDFILCRNLLIYFDEKTKKSAFIQLNKLMKDDATLYIGHAEFGAIPNDIFENTGSDNAFGLIKQKQKNTLTETQRITEPLTRAKNTTKLALKRGLSRRINIEKKATKPNLTKTSLTKKNNASISLENIKKTADQQSFEKAEHDCIEYIKTNPYSAESLYLLGIISSSLKKEAAAESAFRKSLFLNPKHHDALLHLALILDNKGETSSADRLKKRAQKTLLNNEHKNQP